MELALRTTEESSRMAAIKLARCGFGGSLERSQVTAAPLVVGGEI
jgi:hypothetical protein